jgi:hypothetical protein
MRNQALGRKKKALRSLPSGYACNFALSAFITRCGLNGT